MTLDWTVNVGHVLTFMGFIGMIFGFVYALRFEVRGLRGAVGTIQDDVRAVETEIKKISEVMVTLARQEERLTAMDRRLEDLRHGHGFVLEGLPKVIRSDG